MQVVVLSNPLTAQLVSVAAERRPTRLLWAAGGAPLLVGMLTIVSGLVATGTVLVVVGMVLCSILVFFGNPGLWDRRVADASPDQEDGLSAALSSLDERYYLFEGLEAPGVADGLNVLVGPRGLFLLSTMRQGGCIIYRDGVWSNIGRPLDGALMPPARPLADPTLTAARDLIALRARLVAALGASADDLPIDAVIVFTGRDCEIDAPDSPSAVVVLSTLGPHLSLYPEDRLADDVVGHIASRLRDTATPLATGA